MLKASTIAMLLASDTPLANFLHTFLNLFRLASLVVKGSSCKTEVLQEPQ